MHRINKYQTAFLWSTNYDVSEKKVGAKHQKILTSHGYDCTIVDRNEHRSINFRISTCRISRTIA
ncbi:hypothetical protein [Prevotella disiens]|uniref:hypothetical protein n=1 Tax=Prevotella disiens TaxID=28130 RepID=UPI0018FF86CA|nr:hypothetical protein [Prevotella disiens]